MNIDWAALGQVFGVSLVATLGLVAVFTLGIVGTSRKAGPTATAPAAGPGVVARTGAYACFALCAAAVGYGIYLIVA
ncbi:hypothetical protein FGW37_07855 [Streptomyces rectiverticillatus]|uniref:hypothetical protein n=1 Tax=Streptomyces rectiverticillatus TaxID=173860 RepID=UPI0015C334F3|nr:hypothetical protein [Streptomyces rectiverticillatus]QLE71522.1 hypothetical protein FGW37_07855 [Streptomyces rectiverticillatus]